MGCASSAALPFLTTKENQAVVESPILNGKSSTELHKSNTGLNDTEVENLKDINESFISEKMKDVVDSTAVQGVIGGVIQTKENVYNEVKGNSLL